MQFIVEGNESLVTLTEEDLNLMPLEDIKRLRVKRDDMKTACWLFKYIVRRTDHYLAEKFYTEDDDLNDPTGQLHIKYCCRYDKRELTPQVIEELKKFNHANVDVFNECVCQLRERCNGSLPKRNEEEWPAYWIAREAIAYAEPQDTILEKLKDAFGPELAQNAWNKRFSGANR